MLKTFGCSVCKKQAPRKLRKEDEYDFGKRMAWLRRHYELNHPRKFKAMTEKAVATRKANRKTKYGK